jgi:hypothetical protein
MNSIFTDAAFMNVVGGIITLLLGIIAYFLIKLIGSIDKLREIVDSLQVLFTRNDQKLIDFDNKCSSHHLIVDKRFENHKTQIQDHEIRLTKIETKIEK